MTWLDLALMAGLLLALAAAVALAVVLRRERRSTGVELAASRADAAALLERLDRLESRLPPAAAAVETDGSDEADDSRSSYVITGLGDREPEPEQTPRIEGRLFADLVLRETVVRAAGLAHGVRRAASPENRFRMRYAYSREVKAARKRRRMELRRLRRTAAATGPQEREDAA